MVFLAIAPRFGSTSIRAEHEPAGTEERPSTEPAVARCLLHRVMVHSARFLHKEKCIIFSCESAIRPSA
jgi:hypothetical protein